MKTTYYPNNDMWTAEEGEHIATGKTKPKAIENLEKLLKFLALAAAASGAGVFIVTKIVGG